MRTRWILWLILCLLVAGGCYFAAGSEPSAPLESPTAADLGLLLLEEAGQVVVLGVSEASPAAEAGFQPGDRIVSAAGADLSSVDALEALLAGEAEAVLLLVEQGGRERAVEMEVR